MFDFGSRFYDPQLGVWFTPDPAEQFHNPYLAMGNNPVMYVDPDGEMVIGLLRGLGDAIFSGGLEFWNWNENYTRDAWSQADPFNPGTAGNNAARIWGGFFSGHDFFGQLPQNTLGMISAHTSNIFGNVRSVEYFGGATVVQGNNEDLLWGLGGPAFASGNFIVGNKNLRADPNNPLFQHEFGHVLQSREMNWGYFSRVSIPSLASAAGLIDGDHSFHPVEQDANRRAFLYFNERDPEFQDDDMGAALSSANPLDNRGWDFGRNPLDVDRANTSVYIDYSNEVQRNRLNNIRTTKAKWYDSAYWLLGPLGPIGVGIYNAINY